MANSLNSFLSKVRSIHEELQPDFPTRNTSPPYPKAMESQWRWFLHYLCSKKGNIVSIIENADTIIKRKTVRISGGIEIGKLV